MASPAPLVSRAGGSIFEKIPLAGLDALRRADRMTQVAAGLTAVLFLVLFAEPMALLARDWWVLPEAGHGLLLAPVAIWYAWKEGLVADARPNRMLGLSVIGVAVLVRFASGLAAELFTMRGSMVLTLIGLVIFYVGVRQVLRWWLPFLLIGLSIPLPELVTQALALPLQFKASQMGAAMLEARHIPVLLTGNVIRVPGHELFVTEACSGLRSLTALLSTGVLLAALTFKHPISRVLLVLIAVPIAVVVNGVRVFLTGFLVYFVSPKAGTGFMHMTEGWLLFIVSLTFMGMTAWVLSKVERRFLRKEEVADA